ncbi:putative atp :trna-specific trna nucleotidyltransferase [Phaeomoniella chlamydospora]|uniref:Putative atp: trna-specific trna nucleotidyltransferase n=1 Tax=Phaeomoniella chlamydospora TaxID=158046 RepID=A0A0G2GYT7_PHACM|nr:putative atp :trna-specific trna nucleotidyltransferase [Phaeomoniella chlamydospora]
MLFSNVVEMFVAESVDVPLTTTQLLGLLQENAVPVSSQSTAQAHDIILDEAIQCVIALDQENDEREIFRLLKSVIKPLFSASNSAITTAGRKNEFRNKIPGSKWDSSLSFADESKPWKVSATWSLPLLLWLLCRVNDIVMQQTSSNDAPQEKTLVESINHEQAKISSSKPDPLLRDLTPLIAPPILQLIDDSSISSKARGANLLTRFCNALSLAEIYTPRRPHLSSKPNQSLTILTRTGLSSVFIEALTPNLSLLPTLTPEDESLLVLKRIYPAYIAVVKASYPQPDPEPEPTSISLPKHPQVTHLLPLTTHILSSLTHLSDSHPHLQTFLLSQLTNLIHPIGIWIAPNLRRILIYIRQTMCNPFGGVETNRPVLRECIRVCTSLCHVLPERIREGGWWREILRAVVGAWITITDEAEEADLDLKQQERQHQRSKNEGCSKIIEIVEPDDDELQKTNPKPNPIDDTDEESLLKKGLKALVYTLSEIVDSPSSNTNPNTNSDLDTEIISDKNPNPESEPKSSSSSSFSSKESPSPPFRNAIKLLLQEEEKEVKNTTTIKFLFEGILNS